MASSEPQIVIHGEVITSVREAQNLGLIMDSELRFDSHIVEVACNCFYRLKILYKMRNYLCTCVKYLIFKAIYLFSPSS